MKKTPHARMAEEAAAGRIARQQIAAIPWERLPALPEDVLELLLKVAKGGLEQGPRNKWPERETRVLIEELEGEVARRCIVEYIEQRRARAAKPRRKK